MRTLVEKEIRLLLSAFVGALALAILPVWLLPAASFDRGHDGASWAAGLYSLGTLMLVLSSYGGEIGFKTLPFMLAQPLPRARIWWTKFAVLVVCLALAFDALWLSGSLRSILRSARMVPPEILFYSGLAAALLAAGGLWMTLLLRQMVAAFWLTVLIPVATIIVIGEIGGTEWMAFVALGLYAVAAFFLARWQFLHLQDTAWTGGVIAFGSGRAAAAQSAVREHRPWAALLRKELQLQQVTLMGMACLLVMHLGAVALRKAGAHTFGKTTLMVLETFGALWLFVPLLAGSQSVAEERKLGTMEAHLCLPISRRSQWLLKLMVVLVVGGLLSGTLFWAVEHVAGGTHDVGAWAFTFLVLALAGFYGSTLTSGVVQALAAAVLTLLGLWTSLFMLGPPFRYQPLTVFGFRLWSGMLLQYIGWPTLLATLLWLAGRNFRNVSESWRLWRRNALALGGMTALSFGLTTATYNRAWEWLTPLEPPHGPARWSLEKPPVLRSYGGRGLAALLPDGRLWSDRLHYGQRWVSHRIPFGNKWMSLGGKEFAPGSNWVDAVANSRETVGIRSDGTLWVSEKPRKFWDGSNRPLVEQSAGLIRFGHDTNWLHVARLPDWGMLLLKRDGTLWVWGTNSFNTKREEPRLRDFEPRRLGPDSDWAGLLGAQGWIYACAWKTDGSAWILCYPGSLDGLGPKVAEQELQPQVRLLRLAGLDNHRWRGLVSSDNFAFAGIRDDGTLWYCNWYRDWFLHRKALSTNLVAFGGSPPVQIGKESDWAELARSVRGLVARKTNGSLWEWYEPGLWEPLQAIENRPVRLGNHSDWVALGEVGAQFMSLAADGNLWCWPNPEPVGIFGAESDLVLAASRRPVKIENIFGARE